MPSGSLTIAGEISGDDDLVKAAREVVLAAANTYTGVTKIDEGVLEIRNGQALGATAGATELRGGTTLVMRGDIATSESFSLIGVPPVRRFPGVHFVSFGRQRDPLGALTLNPELTVSVPVGTLTIADVISGHDNLMKDGPGALVLTANNLARTVHI